MAKNHGPNLHMNSYARPRNWIEQGLKIAVDFTNRKSYSPQVMSNNYYTWTVGDGSVGDFSQNGDVGEDKRELGTDPFGFTSSIVWNSRSIDGSATVGDGGFITQFFMVDTSKMHRFSVWVKRSNGDISPSISDGQLAFSMYNRDGANNQISATRLDALGSSIAPTIHSTTSANPPFLGGLNCWTLLVGHMWPTNAATMSIVPGSNIENATLAQTCNHPDSGVWVGIVDSSSAINYWKGDGAEINRPTVAIDSLNRANGTIATPQQAGPTWSEAVMTYLPGEKGLAFSFNGNNFVALPDNTLNYIGDFSAGLWFYAPSGMTNSNLISCFDNRGDFTQYNGWTIGVNTTDMSVAFTFGIRMGFPGNPSLQYFEIELKTPAGAFQYDRWTHVLATRKGGARSRIYVDGTLRASDTNIYGPSYIPQGYSSNTAYIGAKYYGWLPNSQPGPFYKAAPAGMKIDEVRTFSAELSSDQAFALASGRGRKIGNGAFAGGSSAPDYIFNRSADRAQLGVRFEYGITGSGTASFIYPRVDVVNGFEPTIDELLTGVEPLRNLAGTGKVYAQHHSRFSPSFNGCMVMERTKFMGFSGMLSEPFTMRAASVWLRPDSTITSATSPQGIFKFGKTLGNFGGGGGGFMLMLGISDFAGIIVGETITIGGDGLTSVQNVPIEGGKWHNITISWETSSYAIYLNGVKQITTSGTTQHQSLFTSDGYADIGGRVGGGAADISFDGRLSSVMAWNRSLSAEDIATLVSVGREKLK